MCIENPTPARDIEQAPLMGGPHGELTVALAGVALGGAERIVLDWAARILWPVHLVVLRDHAHEWPVPESLRVTRLHGVDVLEQLTQAGLHVARSAVPVCVCHLLTAVERRALSAGGAFVVPVIHNAAEGWLEEASALHNADHVVAVSHDSAGALRRGGCDAHVSVIHHVPRARRFTGAERARYRLAWRIPARARVIGMIGGVKAQKDYPFAVRLLRSLNEEGEVYLVILGGPVGRTGREAWHEVLAEMHRQGMRGRLALPGFLPDAAACLPAFDLLLNTSGYEGLSIATLEALANGLPVVASEVGGQGELGSDQLTLVPKDAPLDVWRDAILGRLPAGADGPSRVGSPAGSPAWVGFPAHRLWTLAHLARPFRPDDRVLFVTANLNAGGAQRSLVNLATALTRVPFDVAVTGDSTAGYFLEQLRAAGVAVHRTAASRDAFDHAERLVATICADRIGTVCFWNVDPKIKLLVVKALAFTDVAFVDVSPGPNAFREMEAAAGFARWIAFPAAEFYGRLDRLVVKYDGGRSSGRGAPVTVIPNGVPAARRAKTRYIIDGAPTVAVSGRMAPTKFLVEIVEALKIVRATLPATALHLFGAAEPRHQEYEALVRRAAGDDIGQRVFFHGARGDAYESLADFDAFVVLGEDQGCPNALLEALAAGLPCVANDDGGTNEQIVHDTTGLLVRDRSSVTLAAALVRVLTDRALAERLGRAGRRHVETHFPMSAMVERYEALFQSLSPAADCKEMTA